MECPKCHSENNDSSRFCSNCATPLDQSGPGGVSLTKTLETPVHVLKAGSLIAGKYRIIEEIGHGGMGVVYKAEDLKLKRCVALKFLPPHLLDSPELKERFLVEAQAAAALNHPNICVIHEVGESEERPYIAMEYVEGETLRDRIRKGPLKTEEALDITIQVAAGLGEAHRKGIIHRDIKSANIMVTEKGQTKVMDFGLAKLRGGSSLTKSQTTLGTVAYMSPEQARGEEVDGRTDLWSLGVVLYEMLTGELPFRGDRDLSIIHSIIHEEPKPIRLSKPPVPQELQQVVSRALEKKIEARYNSAEEMLKDLTAYEAALQAEASGVFNLRSLVKRLRRPAVAVPTLLAIGAIAAIAVWFFDRQAKVRWARNVAIPEIERMFEANDIWRNLVPPYNLAVQAEAVLGNDPKLIELFSKCAVNIDIRTEPSGARVSMKEYTSPGSEWTSVGVTPIEKVRVPIGIFRWKFEKEGYESVLAAALAFDSNNLSRVLDKKSSLPSGMVRVEETETPIGKLGVFFIDKYEVTHRQYKEFVDAGGYGNRKYWTHPFRKEGRELTWEEAIGEFVDQTGLRGPSTWYGGDYPEGQADYPVSGVSWYEAAAYAEFAGKSLPTSVHWNAARGGFTPMIQTPQLGGFAVLAPFCNFQGKGPLPVGSLPGISPYGVYDMAGNVREWCSNETPAGRLVRGGAWDDSTYMFDWESQVPPFDRSAKNGFRCVLYPDPKTIPEAALRSLKQIVANELPREVEPAPDPVFQVYREQFAYDKTDLDPRVEYRKESPGGWIREKVSFAAAYGGERVMAYLFLPGSARPPYQAVVYTPADPSVLERSSDGIEDYFEFVMFLSHYVKNGRAVVFPVWKATFERGNDALAAIYAELHTRQHTQLFIEEIKDFRRTIDYLETRPDIDREKLAFCGMCSGAALGAIIPAVEERFKTSILVAGGLVDMGRPEISQINYISRVRIPTLMLNGRYDSLFPLPTSSKPFFDLLGTPDELKEMKLYDTDHIPPRREFIKETLAWLDKYLGPVKRE
jgi:dienelactone hydrolase